MNKKIVVLSLALLVAAMIVTPVLAIGPMVPENNPNKITTPPFVARIITPSGVSHEWIHHPLTVPVKWNVHRFDASKVEIGNAVDGATILSLPPGNFFVTLGILEANENKWLSLSQTQYKNLLLGLGLDPDYVDGVVDEFDQGVYWKINFISAGK